MHAFVQLVGTADIKYLQKILLVGKPHQWPTNQKWWPEASRDDWKATRGCRLERSRPGPKMRQNGCRVWKAQSCSVPLRASSTQRANRLIIGCTCKDVQVVRAVKNRVSTVVHLRQNSESWNEVSEYQSLETTHFDNVARLGQTIKPENKWLCSQAAYVSLCKEPNQRSSRAM